MRWMWIFGCMLWFGCADDPALAELTNLQPPPIGGGGDEGNDDDNAGAGDADDDNCELTLDDYERIDQLLSQIGDLERKKAKILAEIDKLAGWIAEIDQELRDPDLGDLARQVKLAERDQTMRAWLHQTVLLMGVIIDIGKLRDEIAAIENCDE